MESSPFKALSRSEYSHRPDISSFQTWTFPGLTKLKKKEEKTRERWIELAADEAHQATFLHTAELHERAFHSSRFFGRGDHSTLLRGKWREKKLNEQGR